MTNPIDDRDHAALCQAYLDTTAHLRVAHALILHDSLSADICQWYPTVLSVHQIAMLHDTTATCVHERVGQLHAAGIRPGETQAAPLSRDLDEDDSTAEDLDALDPTHDRILTEIADLHRETPPEYPMSTPIPDHLRAGCECRTVADLAAALATLPPDLPVESLMEPSLAVQYLPGIQSHSPGGHYRAHLLIEGYDQDEGQLQHLPEVLP